MEPRMERLVKTPLVEYSDEEIAEEYCRRALRWLEELRRNCTAADFEAATKWKQ